MRGTGGKQGFTLVEMMVAMGIAMVIGIGSLAIVNETKKGVKKASDSAEIPLLLNNVLSVLSDPNRCHQALREVHLPAGSGPVTNAAMAVGSAQINWENMPGYPVEFLPASAPAFAPRRHLLGMISVPSENDPVGYPVLVQHDVAQRLGLPSGLSPQSQYRVKHLLLDRRDDPLTIHREEGLCTFRSELRIHFARFIPHPDGLSSWSGEVQKSIMLNMKVPCPDAPNGDSPFLHPISQLGLQPILGCGAYIPNTEQACRDLGGTYQPHGHPKCMFRSITVAHSWLHGATPEIIPSAPIPAPSINSWSSFQVRPGLTTLRGRDIVAHVLSTTSKAGAPPWTAPQLTFARAQLEPMANENDPAGAPIACEGETDRNRSQTALGTVSFRGLNRQSATSALDYMQASSIIATTDGHWSPGSSPARLNFHVSQENRPHWLVADGDPTGNLHHLLKRYPVQSTGMPTGEAIPALSIRQNQVLQASSEIKFGVAVKFPSEVVNPNAPHVATSMRGGKLALLSEGNRSLIQISAEYGLTDRLRLYNTNSTKNLTLEAGLLELKENPAASPFLTVNLNEFRMSGYGVEYKHAPDQSQPPITSLSQRTVLAASDREGRARWMQPRMIRRTGVVKMPWTRLGCAGNTTCRDYNSTGWAGDVLSPELNLNTCEHSGNVPTGLRFDRYRANANDGAYDIYCTNFSGPGASPVTAAEREAIKNGSDVSDAMDIEWDFCTLTFVSNVPYVQDLLSASNPGSLMGSPNDDEINLTAGGACQIMATPTGWKLRATMKSRADVRCRAQCFKLIFGE